MSQHILYFAVEMQRELDGNGHKSGWWHLTPKQCLHRMRQELKELTKAVAEKKPPEEVISECADVANFAMFLSHNYKSWLKEQE